MTGTARTAVKKGIQEFLLVATPKAIGGMALIGLNLTLVRFLPPDAFGRYYVCLTAVVLADAVIGAAFDMGVLRLAPAYIANDMTYAIAIERAALLLKVGLASLVTLVLLVDPGFVSQAVFHRSGAETLLYLTIGSAVGLLLLRSGLVHLQVRRAFRAYGLVDFSHMAIKFGGVGLGIALLPVDPEHVLIFFALGPAVAFGGFLVRYGRVFWQSLVRNGAAFKELLGYVKWYLITFAAGAIISRFDLIMLTSRAGIDEVGIFSGAHAYALIPEVFGTYLTVVLSPRIVPLCQQQKFFGFFRGVQLGLLALALSIFALAVGLHQSVAALLFPPSFLPSANVILILLPGALANMATFPLTLPFLMFQRPRFFLSLEVATLPALVIAYTYAIDAHGAIGAAWVTTLARLAKLTIANTLAYRLAKQN